MKNKRGQFYLVASIIVVAVVIALAATLNNSSRESTNIAEDIAVELRIEGENVLDYEENTGTNVFVDQFSRDYSVYAGEDKDIYFIVVDKSTGFQDAYIYTNGQKVPLESDLVVGEEIVFRYDSRNYNFKLEEGKSFYYIIVYETGGDRYVVAN